MPGGEAGRGPAASAGAGITPVARFAGVIVALGLGVRVLGEVLSRATVLPAADYGASILAWEFLGRVGRVLIDRVSLPGLLVAITLVILALRADTRWWARKGRRWIGAWWQRASGGWQELDDWSALRALVLGITAVSAWALGAYPRNLYLDQAHLVDRLLLLTLWAAIWRWPAATLPFALVAHVIAGQFVVPLGGISWTEMEVVLHFPVLFGAFWIVRAATGERHAGSFVFMWCCVVAATLWSSGLGKLRADWLSHPQVHLLLLGAHANGWLGAVATEQVTRWAQFLAPVAPLMMITTIGIECGALLLLWRRWSLTAFLVLAAAFHLGAFVLTGILFWKWMMMDAVLLVFLLRHPDLARLQLFGAWRFALSVLVIGTSPAWLSAENLTWYDTPLTYTLRLEGLEADGTAHALPPGYFRPYSDALVLGTFPEVSPHVQLTSAMGVTHDRDLAEALVAAPTAEAIVRLEEDRGRHRFAPDAAAAFDALVGRYAARAECRDRRESAPWRFMIPPRHLWTQPLDAVLPCGVRFTRVRVHENTSWYDGSVLRVIRSRVIREIEVPDPGDPAREGAAVPR